MSLPKFEIIHKAKGPEWTRWEIELEEEIYCEELNEYFRLLALHSYDTHCELYEALYDSFDVSYDLEHLLDPEPLLYECIKRNLNEPAEDVTEEFLEYLEEGDMYD